MTGILYLILGSLCGKELAEIFVGQKKTGKNNRIWLVLPGAFGVGMLAFGWVTYLIAWAADVYKRQPLQCAGIVRGVFYYKKSRTAARSNRLL